MLMRETILPIMGLCALMNVIKHAVGKIVIINIVGNKKVE